METTITIQNRELSTRVKNKKQIIMKKFYLLAAAATISRPRQRRSSINRFRDLPREVTESRCKQPVRYDFRQWRLWRLWL